jgi:nickel superoxide dismutase
MKQHILTSVVSRGLRSIDRMSAPGVAEAHCDIPCGIYDPHLMQIGALTVVRMHQLIEAIEPPAPGGPAGEGRKTFNSMARYIAVKEEHSELVKREVRIIWGDYFKAEHLEKYPDLNDVAWGILKLAGKTKQEVNMQFAQDLLAQTQKFAEIFWDTKGVKTKRVPSNQGAAGGELVVPA